jgi:hypothetical protein
MENFNLKKFLVENKLTTNSRLISENQSIDPQKLKDALSALRNGAASADLPGKNVEPKIPAMKRYTKEKIQPYLTKVGITQETRFGGSGFQQSKWGGRTGLELVLDLPHLLGGADLETIKYKALAQIQEMQDVFGYLADSFRLVIKDYEARVTVMFSEKWEKLTQGKLNLLGEIEKILETNEAKPYYGTDLVTTKGRNGYVVTATRYQLLTGDDFKILEASLRSKFGQDFIKIPEPTLGYANIEGYTDYKIFFTPEIKNRYK